MTSVYDLLNNEEKKYAERQGWQLCHVYVQDASHWQVEALAAGTNTDIAIAKAIVIRAAHAGDQVAARALQLITQSHGAPKK